MKRKNTTIFLVLEKSDSFGGAKQKLASIINVPATSIKLYTSTDTSAGDLQDAASVDNFVENDNVLYMILKKEGSEAWEVRRSANGKQRGCWNERQPRRRSRSWTLLGRSQHEVVNASFRDINGHESDVSVAVDSSRRGSENGVHRPRACGETTRISSVVAVLGLVPYD